MASADRYTVEYGIYRTQVFRKPAMLNYVPEKYKTYELCLAAFVFDEVACLQYVPDEHKTYELCLTAVKCCGPNLYFVPKKHKTEQMKIAAMEANRFVDVEHSLLNEVQETSGILPALEDFDILDTEQILDRFEMHNRLNAFSASLEWD